MDCTTARMLATFFGRGGAELAADDATALAAHLAACPACAAAVQQERAFDDRIGQAMLAVPVPANLHAKLLDGLAVQQGAAHRHKFFGAAALAASVLVVAAGVIGWRILHAPTLDLDQVLAQADDSARAPRDHAERLLRDEGVDFDPYNLRFDMMLLSAVGKENLQGQQVPTLYFQNTRKNSTAKVFVIKKTQFDWNGLKGQPPVQNHEGFGHQVVLLEHAVRDDRAYVVVFTGGSLEPFLDNNSSLGR